MRRFLTILVATGLALVGCNHAEIELVESPGEFESTSDTTLRVQVQFQVSLPELTPLSKALGETPAGDLTSMYIAVFGRSGYLKEYVEAQIQAPTANGKIDESTNRYTITATLALSENSERHIHFLGNGPESMEFGQETDLIPNLMSPVGKGGYWQYIVVPGIKAKRNRDIHTAEYLASHPDVDPDEFILENGHYVLHNETAAYFADVPLIRNFSKIVVEDKPGCNFVTHSFAAVNIAKSGSISPYSGSFAEGYRNGFVENYQTLSYTDLRNTLKYPALLPLHATFDDSVPSTTAFENIGAGVASSNGSVYMYERPIPDDDQKPTSVIIYGHYTDPDTQDGDDESGDYYYKVDLMDASGYYPIYRNFKYRIQIKEILRPGANSPEDALRTMGSGDISADIATQNLTEISDGTSQILVSYMNKTLIHQYPHHTEQLTLLYKYIPVVDADEDNDGETDWNNVLVENGGPVSITLQTMNDDPIITSYTVGSEDDAKGFRTITITTSAPTGYLRTQYIQIKGTHTVTTTDPETHETTTTSTSLYRNVTFSMISTQTMTVTCSPSRVAQEAEQPVTVNITIPKSLPSSMFPLVFYIEAEQLSLTPDNTKENNNLPVNSSTSIYGTGKPAFHFIRTVSEEEYIRLSNASTTTTVTIPCYFKTNKEQSASNIRVIDEEGYFTVGNTSFKNIGSGLEFTDLHFPETGVPKTTGSLTTFTFKLDNSDDLPEKVYLKFTNVRPTPTSGLSIITDTSNEYHGWYWYSPATTLVNDLKNGSRYNPIVNLATTNATGIAEVWIKAPEYEDAYLKYEVPATGITIEGARALILNTGNINDTFVDLTAIVTPSNSTDVVEWTSSNTGVATVDANGHVTAVSIGSATITATARAGVSASVTIQVRKLSFSNQGFTLTDGGNTTVTELPLGLRDVYFRFDYVSGYKYPVTFTLSGLTSQDNRLVDNNDGTFTFTPAQGDENLTQYVHLKSTSRFTGASAQISNEYYEAVSNDSKSLTRPASFQIPQNAIYIRNASTGNPANFTTGSTSVYVNGSSARDYFASSTYSNSYLNNNAMTMTLNRFTIVDDDAPVYFWYQFYSGNRYYYADASATLAELFDSINGGQSYYTLNFRILVTGVSLNRTTAYVAPGRTLNLVATVLPSGADDSSVSWISSDTSVATVDNNGVVTVPSDATVGSTATITVTTHEGGYTASCVVTVKRWAFTGGFSGSVFYGNGWSATYTLTIPADYEMPSGGIDIELALTNLSPDDPNITESGGKYYYHATSTGSQTLSFKTSGDRTGNVSVGLSHNDFNPATAVTATRSYLNIAARGINMTSSSWRLFNNATAYVYSNKSLNNQLVSFATSRNGNYAGYNSSAVSFANNVLDASSRVYFKVGSEYAASTAEQMVNGETIAFSNTLAGRKEVTINTTTANYSTSDKTQTEDGVTVEFSSLYQVQWNRLDMTNPSTVTVSVENGYHLVSVVFNYFRSVGTTYYPGSYSINSGGGTYVTGGSNNTTGTWTPSNNSTSSVTLNFSGNGNNKVAISSVEIVAVDE